MATPRAAPALCPDWVLSTGSNAHAARDRAWFSTYTPFPTYTTSSYIVSDPTEALGVGDVHLPVKLFPKRSGPAAHGTLHLRNVLHIPTAICNIIGSPADDEYCKIVMGLGDNGKDAAITAQDGGRLGYFDNRSLWVLKLSGPPIGPVVGPSMLEPGTSYLINIQWPDSERHRWASAQAGHLLSGHSTNREVSDGRKRKAEGDPGSSEAPPYTEVEKRWLKRVWGGEFKFLMAYELNIYKDEDREEGRRIARGLMELDEDGDTNT